ncbi:MAG: hypothetical protein ACR2OZ_20005 [Verrucomicrobiales bacterium]
MSLKSFHVFFIVLAILCTLGFCAWVFQADHVTVALCVSGVVSGVIGVALAVYGVWFVVKKARKIIV